MKKCKCLLALLLCAVMLLTVSGCTVSFTYQKARNLFIKEQYEEAVKKFEELGDYGDSQEMVSICYYELGREAMRAEQWQKAIDYFGKTDYQDAAEKLQECKDKLKD